MANDNVLVSAVTLTKIGDAIRSKGAQLTLNSNKYTIVMVKVKLHLEL